MRRAGSSRIRATVRSLPASPAAQRQNARCLTARAGTAARVRCALRTALRGRRAMIAYATHAASARSGSRLARRELRAASRLIAHSDRRATAPTSTIRPPCSARSSSWRSRLPCPGGRSAPARRARPRRTRARPPARSAAEPPLAPRPLPAGDAPGTPRCRAPAATCAQLPQPLAPSRSSRAVPRTRSRSVSQPVVAPLCVPLAGRSLVDRPRCRCGAGGAVQVRGRGVPVVALQRLGHDPVKLRVDSLLRRALDRRRRLAACRPPSRLRSRASRRSCLRAILACRRSRTSSRRSESAFSIEPIRASLWMSLSEPAVTGSRVC